jgi:hypothetical protein
MVPEFSTALMVLSEGDVSLPVKTNFGWHLIKLNETREKKILSICLFNFSYNFPYFLFSKNIFSR